MTALTPAEIAALPYRPCAGVVLARADGTVFAGKRIDNPGDAWQMPQGGVDPGEDLHAAALRELWEETGVTSDLVTVEGETAGPITYELPPELLGRLWGGRFRGQSQRLAADALPTAPTPTSTSRPRASPTPPSSPSGAGLTPADLVTRIVPFKRHVYDAVFAELKP